MAMLRAPKKGAVACSLPLTHLHSPLPAQMLNENIQVASLITDSLQQKVYNMALEELEAFLGRSVEPLAALPVLTDPGSRGQAPQADGGDPPWGTQRSSRSQKAQQPACPWG